MTKILLFRQKKGTLLFLLPLILLLSAGCGASAVSGAFKGKFIKSKNNKIINDYCTGCHVHNSFSPDEHVRKVTGLYTKDKYKNADECGICHYLKRTFMRDIIEKTIYPDPQIIQINTD